MGVVSPFPIIARPATPAPVAPSDALPATGGRRGEYALADLARPLGLLHRPIRKIIEALRALAAHEGMPLPRTPRIVEGVPLRGPEAICKNSRWDAGEIDAWLENGRGPASPSPAVSVAPPVREEMRARAAKIGQKIGQAA